MKNIMIFLIFTSVFLTGIAQACTGIRLVANDGSPIFGRTEEFGDDVFEVNWKFSREITHFKVIRQMVAMENSGKVNMVL